MNARCGRPRRRVRAVIAGLLILTAAPAARADDEDFDRGAFRTRPTALSAFAGSAAPFGNVGAQIEHAPHPFIAFFGGFGRSKHGLHYGGGARVQMPLINAGRGYAPGVAFSLSRGRATSAFDRDAEPTPIGAWWMNVESSIERRTDCGFLARAVLGYGLMIDPTLVPPSQVTATRSAYFAVHVGWAF